MQRKQVTGETWRESMYSKASFPAFVLPISRETMRGSCLEYSQLNRALDLELPVIEYLAWYTKYPAVEYLWKMGHARLIGQRLTERGSGQLIRQAVNLRAKTPKELFRCADKRFLRMLPGLRAEEITMFRRLFETGAVEADEAGRSWAVAMAHTACALPEAESAGLRRYIARQAARTGHGLKNTLRDYMDYRRQAARFDAPIWPDDLQLSHTRLSARERTAVDWRSNELFRARRHLWRWAVWHWNGMLIRPVDSAFEIVREGEQNCNCVAGYAKSHVEGRKIIFVLRHADRPRESWHTVELMPDTLAVVQCRGCHNAPATPEAREFIGLWMERLRAMRSERSKRA